MYKEFIWHYRFDVNVRLFERYGWLPGPRYRWRYLVDGDAVHEEQRRADYMTMARFYRDNKAPLILSTLERRHVGAVQDISENALTDDREFFDLATQLIVATVHDSGRRLAVSTTNGASVPNLSSDAVLDLTSAIHRDGPRPLPIEALPDEIVGLQATLVESQRLAVMAAISANREDLLRAIVAHPTVDSADAAERCMDAMLDRLMPWLPQFKAN